ncbi:MAG: c-type cytochrome [Methylococcaceae bacterium]|nr:c-type cytochrome [Methylococcaceae bacterium]
MIKKILAVSISLALSATVSIVHAKDDVNAGKQQAAACAGCHGADGNSAVSTFPKLAGQHASYLVKELQALKAGIRDAPMMAPLAMGLSDDAMSDLAAFYASQTISKNPMPKLPIDDDDDDDEDEDEAAVAAKEKAQQEKLENLLAKGSDLYRNGDLEDEVSACIACHGPVGEGNQPAAYPILKGQHADYLIKTLTDFKNGNRIKNTEDMMNMIAKKMSADEIQAVSYYLSVMDKQTKSTEK